MAAETDRDFEKRAREDIDLLRRQRVDLFDAMIDAQQSVRLLAAAEARRLQARYGDDDIRARDLLSSGDAISKRIQVLKAEREIAGIRPAALPTGGALVQGRVTDLQHHAVDSVIVRLTSEKGEPVAGIEPVTTDASGYYAFALSPETVKAIGPGTKLQVATTLAAERRAALATKPFTIASDAVVMQELPVGASDLEKLGLRFSAAETKKTAEIIEADAKKAADAAAAEAKKAAEIEARKAADAAAAETRRAADAAAAEAKKTAEAEAKRAAEAAALEARQAAEVDARTKAEAAAAEARKVAEAAARKLADATALEAKKAADAAATLVARRAAEAPAKPADDTAAPGKTPRTGKPPSGRGKGGKA